MTPGSRPITDTKTRPDTYWWKETKQKLAAAVFGNVQYLDQIQSSRRALMLTNLQMYSARMASSFAPTNFDQSADTGSRIRMNVVKSAIDTAVAHMATERTRAMYLGKGANFEQRERAEALTHFMLGQFHYMKRYPKALPIFRDAAIFGPGLEKFYEHPMYPGRICSERVFPDELIYDVVETSNAQPRSIFQHKPIAKELLEANPAFRKHKKAIRAAIRIREDGNDVVGINEPVSVIEAWHLPSGPNAKDGKHAICINNACLFEEEWTFEEFPFSIFQWSDPVIGFIGMSAAEELTSLQMEINYIAQKIQRLMTLATSVVWKEKGAGVSKLTNQDWGQYEYSGKPPIFQNISSVSAEYFHHLDRLYQRAFELVGVSQLAAQSKKPAGIDSGEGLRVLNDIGAKRFMHISQRWEQFHLDAAERIYDVACAIRKAGRNPSVLAPTDNGLKEIHFDRAYMERNKYSIQAYPAALLPEEPAGQIETLKGLSQAFPELRPYLPQALESAPDMKQIVSQLSAPFKVAQKMIHNILKGEEYAAPFAGMDLAAARTAGTMALNAAYLDDSINDDKVMHLSRWLGQVDELQMASQPMPMPQGGPGGVPGGGPGGPKPTIAPAPPIQTPQSPSAPPGPAMQ